jgi:filamentous hemagglutinin
MTAMEHIKHRHSYESAYTNVSKFSKGTSEKMIQKYVNQAVKYGKPISGGYEYNIGNVIGRNRYGEATSSIRVFVQNDWVRTAYPY